MADFFLSYANEDRQRAAALARALEAADWTVRWERRILGVKAARVIAGDELRAPRIGSNLRLRFA
jgi:hypothetical protein